MRPDFAVHHGNNLLDNGQSNAGTLVFVLGVEALKNLENFFCVHIVKADSIIDIHYPVHRPAVALDEVAGDLDSIILLQ